MNVLLVTIDSLRPDFLGCYGSSELLSPNIDLLAKEGVLFKSVISQGPTTPESFPAMLSGQYTGRYVDAYQGLSAKRTLISEILKRQGFFTAAVHSNPYISRYKNYQRGFDYFEDNLFEIKSINSHWLRKKLIHLKSFFTIPYTPANTINTQVFRWLAKNLNPYFLWVHYMDVHGPYISKTGWPLANRIKASMIWGKASNSPDKLTDNEKENIVKCYKEEIECLDVYLKSLLDNINHNDTVIILMADHGEFMGEHGLYGHPPFYLYDPLLKIPLIIKLPKKLHVPGNEINITVKSIDIVPTILDILNIKAEAKFDGETLLPLMRGIPNSYSSEAIISETSINYIAARKDRWKLIYRIQGAQKILELYDLINDPLEETNLVKEKKEIALKMESIITTHLKNNKILIDNPENIQSLSDIEEIKAQLKRLGYH